MYAAVEVQLYPFLISTLAGGEWSASHIARFTPVPNEEQATRVPESVWTLRRRKTLPIPVQDETSITW
jgi:hypothetical protein